MAESVACTLVRGVRSSWPASAAKRCVARARGRGPRPSATGAQHRVEAPRQRPQLGRPADGDRPSRSSSVSIPAAAARSRRSGRSTRSAASQTPAAATTSTASPISGSRRRSAGWRCSRSASLVATSRRTRPPRPGVAQRRDVGAVPRAVDRDGAKPRGGARCGRERRARVERTGAADRQPQRAARSRAGRRRGGGRPRAGRPGPPSTAVGARELGGAPQAVVEGRALRAVDVAGDSPGDDEHHREDGDDPERQPAAEPAHRAQGRRTNPTPRTVCRTRGSPSASSLRRR